MNGEGWRVVVVHAVAVYALLYTAGVILDALNAGAF